MGLEKRASLEAFCKQHIDLFRHQSVLRRFFASRVSPRCEVEDLVQEALTRYIVAQRGGDLSNPIGYLFRIANNLLVDRARRASRLPPHVGVLEEHEHPETRADQEDALHLADLRSQLHDALDELPRSCREAFILKRFHEVDTPAIASQLNVSHRMVQKYLAKATAHLTVRLQ